MRVPAHEATSAQLCAAYPFVLRRPLPGGAVLVGREVSGASFVHDPFELYRLGRLTNPNLLVLGQIGRGKSAFVKSYCYRHAAFGRRVVVLDPKGEYGPLAAALGVEPLVLAPHGRHRLNPLDGRTLGEDRHLRRCETAGAVAVALLGRALRPVEYALLELALERSTGPVPLFPELVEILLAPGRELARSLYASEAVVAGEARELAFALRRLCGGELGGLFDAPTSAEVDLAAASVVVDLSAIYRSGALGVAIVCVQALLEDLAASSAGQTLFVIDEAWALFANLGAAQFLQSSLKLARARGTANILVTHRVSDLRAASGPGSRLAEGLLADCETVVCYAQAESETSDATRSLGLSVAEARLLPRLRRGVALWRVGNDPHLVEHRLAASERLLVDTDSAMTAPPLAESPAGRHRVAPRVAH